MSSSSRTCMHRLLIVHVKSAQIKTKHKGPFFVNLSFNPEDKLETTSVFHSDRFHVTWNQGFVFAVPLAGLSDGKSSLKFEIFRKNRYFKDSLLDKFEIKLDDFEGKKEGGAEIEEVRYDSSSEDSEREDKKERVRGEREEFPEMQKTVSVEIKKGKLEVEIVVSKGSLSKVGKHCDWEGFAMELEEFLGNKGSSKKDEKKKTSFCLMCVRH